MRREVIALSYDDESFDGADYLTHLEGDDYALDARERELGRQRLRAFGVGSRATAVAHSVAERERIGR